MIYIGQPRIRIMHCCYLSLANLWKCYCVISQFHNFYALSSAQTSARKSGIYSSVAGRVGHKSEIVFVGDLRNPQACKNAATP